MKKKVLAVLLAAVMILGSVAMAAGDTQISVVKGMKLVVNGQELNPVNAAGDALELFSYNNATYVPLRYLAELLGLEVGWDAEHPTDAILNGDVPGVKEEAPAPAIVPTGDFAKDGTYTGKAWGRNAEMTVETVIEGGKIVAVNILEEEETDGVKVAAMKHIPDWIVEYNSVNIDAVCGATLTSKGITFAVRDCILQAGGNLSRYSTHGPVIEEKQGETYECDVVVVGAGASGATAASTAAAAGAKVILLEKTATIGGSSNLSSGGTFHNTPLSIAAGAAQTDVEATIANWIEVNHYRVDAAVIRRYVTESGTVPGWVEEHGGPLKGDPATGRYALLVYEEREPAFRNMLNNTVIEGGGQIITECTAYELVQAADGTITGVKGRLWDGTLIQVNAKAVVMATGGYGANAEMVWENFGFGGVNGGVGQNIGEGLEMVWAVGGKKPINFGGQMLHQTLARATETLKHQGVQNMYQIYPMILTYVSSLMNVSPAGYRFRNEETVSNAVSAANTSAFNGPFHYVIVSQQMLETLETEGLPGLNVTRRPGLPPLFYRSFAESEKPYELEALWDGVQEVFDQAIANGHIFKGNTPAELAEAAGMDVNTFVAEFEAYEEACKNGVDPDFGKGAANLLSLGEGPYYAIIAEINDLGSAGGMVINKNFQILDEDRVAIPGLYAVGSESIGVMYNDTYVGSGVGVGYAFTSGKLGGESAAKYALSVEAKPAAAEEQPAEKPAEAEEKPAEEQPAEGGVSGTFTGVGGGFGGEVTATITVENGKIVDVKLAGPGETPGIGGAALEPLAESATANAGLPDAVSGASLTSAAAKDAVAAAMEAAGL